MSLGDSTTLAGRRQRPEPLRSLLLPEAGDGTRRGRRRNLKRWLELLLAALSPRARRRMCPLHAGTRLHPIPEAREWKVAPSQALLPAQANQPVGHKNASPVVDDTARPSTGPHSVGIAPQYQTVLGKNASRQTLVFLLGPAIGSHALCS